LQQVKEKNSSGAIISQTDNIRNGNEQITKTTKNGLTMTASVTNVPEADGLGYTITEKNTSGIISIYKYRLSNGDVRLTEVSNAGETLFYEYNSDGNLTKITSKDSYGNTILEQDVNYTNGSFSYAELGNNSYNATYNSNLLLENIKKGAANLISYQYYPNGYLSNVNFANGNSATLNYNINNNKILQSIAYSGLYSEQINYQTDGYGRTTGITQQEGSLTVLTYDFGNLDNKTQRTFGITGLNGYSANYTYNIDSDKQRLTTEAHNIASNSYTVTYGYNTDDYISSIQIGSFKNEITYDSLNRISSTTVKYNNYPIFDNHYEYQSKNISGYSSTTSQLTKIWDYMHYGSCQDMGYIPYVYYDNNGRIDTVYNGRNTYALDYTYDAAGRLKTEEYGTYGSLMKKYNYNANNDLTGVDYWNGYYWTGEESYSYDSNNRLSYYRNYDTNKYYNFAYDSMGNPTKYKVNSLSDPQNMYWTRGRMLASGTLNGNNFTYKYDADGLRYQKTVGSTTTQYYYNGSDLVAEKRGSTFIYYLYGIDGIAGMVYNGTYYFFEKNILGDIIGIMNSSGTEIATYNYDAWGNITSQTGSMASVNPFRYRGYYQDDETGFYYLNTRYYDPEIRRFINADNYELLPELAGVLGQLNLYAYCNNNPVMYTDPDGEFPFFLLTALIGLVAGGVIGGITSNWSLEGILIGAGIGFLGGALLGAGYAGAVAGNFGASITSVVTGTKIVASTFTAAGSTAGFKMIADNFSSAFHNYSHVFWTGGDLAKNKAMNLASNIGGKTIEMTRLGQYFETIGANSRLWDLASANFANTANSVNAVVNTFYQYTTFWSLEYQILLAKGIAVNFIYLI
jgi:RHS repeat-associated protein